MASLIGTTMSMRASLTISGARCRSRLVLAAGKPIRRVVGASVVATVQSPRTLTAAVSGTARAETGGPLLGPFADIPDVINNELVQNLGKWAVEQHNKEAGDNVKFGAVVQAQSQVVNVIGMNYHLVIQGKNREGVLETYLAFVWESVFLVHGAPEIKLTMFHRLLN
jgi:cystatin-C